MKSLTERYLRRAIKEQLVVGFGDLAVVDKTASTVEQAPGMFPGMSSVGLTAEDEVKEPSDEECQLVATQIVAECRRNNQ